MATVRAQVRLSLFDDFENFSVFKPRSFQEQDLGLVFDQVLAWAGALRTVRESKRSKT